MTRRIAKQVLECKPLGPAHPGCPTKSLTDQIHAEVVGKSNSVYTVYEDIPPNLNAIIR